ncbi:MAG: hypothetical protein JRD05_02985 [Deltaproteobacteria bacterium]|nr:hypothetical protein [Deltaproteobacteria bacterium]
MKKKETGINETILKKKKYSPPEIQEHRTLDKAKDCSIYVSSYNSGDGIYYH